MHFANPNLFYFLILIPVLAFFYFWKLSKQNPQLVISTGAVVKSIKKSPRVHLRHLPFFFTLIGLGFIIFALARPQTSSTRKEIQTEGVDIVLAMDVSTSMLAEDLKPNRIESAKKNAIKFLEERKNDRIGLVVFAGESFTQCPITIDHSILKNLVDKLKSGMLEDGTAIGMGLATSVARLKDSKAKSKIIVLLTDGINNTGFISPETAAEIAKTFGIKVYTIGVGTRGLAPYPFKTPFGTQYQKVNVQIDENMLKKIASLTGGNYFRATNSKSLEEIYNEINSMEKTKIDVAYFTKKTEEYLIFALFGSAFIVISVILKYSIFARLP
ncbi:MAG: aerotolerance regulator BatA [Ignavibacteria bacterium GWF2_33_9]|nr:MAG: aerotolerance regulator BatA [Ignavibacteria bacterium GWF2_33_9]